MASRTSQVSARSTILPLVEESDTACWFLVGQVLASGTGPDGRIVRSRSDLWNDPNEEGLRTLGSIFEGVNQKSGKPRDRTGCEGDGPLRF